jgi:hypothetical protein
MIGQRTKEAEAALTVTRKQGVQLGRGWPDVASPSLRNPGRCVAWYEHYRTDHHRLLERDSAVRCAVRGCVRRNPRGEP